MTPTEWGTEMKILMAFAGAMALATGAQAATFDAFDSFNGTQGAGGFYYLRMPPPNSGLDPTPLATSGACVVTSSFCLQDGAGLPGVYKSLTTLSELTYTVPNDRLLAHPGAGNPLGIFFVAPQAGVYDFTASFDILDRSPSGVFIAGFTTAGGAVSSVQGGLLNSQNLAFTRTGSLTMAQGEILGFIINNGGNYANDSTGVDIRLTTAGVPEPATWAMMILGFGAAGSILRRRAAIALG
jgi:hypothetical protein